MSEDDAGRGDLLPHITTEPPAAASRALARRLSRVESRNVTHLAEDFPVFWTRARGCNVWDPDGNRYVDLTSGFAVSAVGHRHPGVERALGLQGGELLHGMGDVHPPETKVELLERLAALAPLDDPRVILGVTGSDAVEAALKTAMIHSGRPGVLAFTGAYHGLSYGALSVTHRAHFRAPFEAQLNPHVLRAGFPHPYRPPDRPGFPEPPAHADEVAAASVSEVERLLDGEAGRRVGAVIVEPVQGRGGDVAPPPGFLASLAGLCRERGCLLILDEVYTGFGRTGRRFACLEDDVIPDLLCVGKGFSGGMPLSACLGRREVMDAWPASEGEAIHTSTFLGHPLSCAAALATLDVLEEEGLAGRARELGRWWREELREMAAGHDLVGEVRGRGLMIGLDLVRDAATREPASAAAERVVKTALRSGWILLAGGPRGNVLSLSPPLNVPRELLEAATRALDRALEEAAAG